MPRDRARLCGRWLFVAGLLGLSSGCACSPAGAPPPVAPPSVAAATAGSGYYPLEGFYVFPLKELPLGAGREEVLRLLGEPTARWTRGFREPARVRLRTLPPFDEQWGWLEGLGSRWVFFREGRMVAAFREESDW